MPYHSGMADDIHFDQLAERFERKIYGSEKGNLRLQLLWDDMLTAIPALQAGKPLRVLDAGGGLGQISQRLAALGHHVVLTEPAAPMLERAQQLFMENGIDSTHVQFVQASIQQLPGVLLQQPFDLVVCHAVLEWLADPLATLAPLLRWIKPGGYLSLAFYNRESIVWKNLLKGNINKARARQLTGEAGGLTPQNPQSAPEVLAWLRQHELDIVQVTGIRCLNDYVYPGVQIDAATLLEVERELGRQEPYKWLGRYIHTIGRSVVP
ncbi:MAG TPA: methyltransferase domain-containing protein [Pseudomonadales bacterium]|nr:methyltransferase domain-containing protein [Pseudomonadales bacterium]